MIREAAAEGARKALAMLGTPEERQNLQRETMQSTMQACFSAMIAEVHKLGTGGARGQGSSPQGQTSRSAANGWRGEEPLTVQSRLVRTGANASSLHEVDNANVLKKFMAGCKRMSLLSGCTVSLKEAHDMLRTEEQAKSTAAYFKQYHVPAEDVSPHVPLHMPSSADSALVLWPVCIV